MINEKNDSKYIYIGIIIMLVIILGFYVISNQQKSSNQPTSSNNNYNPPSTTGNVVNNPPAQQNSDAEMLNQAFDFIRSCLLNCQKECPSCGVLSLSCVKSCENSARSKLNNNKDFSDEELNRLLNDRNLKWKACMTSCENVYSGESYIDIDCFRGCGS
jgi:hypothetical protein